MTKADIIEYIQELGYPKAQATTIVEAFFEIIKGSLKRGELVKISGFGTFNVRKKPARRGRNPQTGQELTISARQVLTFKPSNILKSVINSDI